MSIDTHKLNTKPYMADFIVFEIIESDPESEPYVHPWLAMEDIDLADASNIVMYSLMDKTLKEFDVSSFKYKSSVSHFYQYMTEKAGLSESKMTNLIFGTQSVDNYEPAFLSVFNTACFDYTRLLDSYMYELVKDYEPESDAEDDKPKEKEDESIASEPLTSHSPVDVSVEKKDRNLEIEPSDPDEEPNFEP